jgi:hypothetical protein
MPSTPTDAIPDRLAATRNAWCRPGPTGSAVLLKWVSQVRILPGAPHHQGADQHLPSARVDVAAAVIHSGLTVDEISDLDLTYTPPPGSLWDAVQVGARGWEAAR